MTTLAFSIAILNLVKLSLKIYPALGFRKPPVDLFVFAHS